MCACVCVCVYVCVRAHMCNNRAFHSFIVGKRVDEKFCWSSQTLVFCLEVVNVLKDLFSLFSGCCIASRICAKYLKTEDSCSVIMEISSCVKGVRIAADQYNNNRSSSNVGYLLHELEVRVGFVLSVFCIVYLFDWLWFFFFLGGGGGGLGGMFCLVVVGVCLGFFWGGGEGVLLVSWLVF